MSTIDTADPALPEAALEALVGRPLPGGTLSIPSHRQWLLNDVISGPGAAAGGLEANIAHPLFVYLATGAMGVSWDELFEICGAKASDGPMFGEHETVLHRPLLVGETYNVSGKFVSALRKEGRKTGVFDVIGYALTLRDLNGDVVAETTNSIVFPRRSR